MGELPMQGLWNLLIICVTVIARSAKVVLTCVKQEAWWLPGLEVERDLVVGGEDGFDSPHLQVVGDVLSTSQRGFRCRLICLKKDGGVSYLVNESVTSNFVLYNLILGDNVDLRDMMKTLRGAKRKRMVLGFSLFLSLSLSLYLSISSFFSLSLSL